MAKRKTTRQISSDPFKLRPEVIGLVLMALALLTLLSMFSSNNGSLTGAWLDFLARLFGWGRFVIWIVFGILGFWFVRKFGSEDDDEKWEKPVGSVLLLAVLLAVFDFISPGADPIASTETGGGGMFGWMLRNLLSSALDDLGAIVVLFFVTIFSVILISGLSLRELVDIIQEWYYRFQDWRHSKKLVTAHQPELPLDDQSDRISVMAMLNRYRKSDDEDDEPTQVVINQTQTSTAERTPPPQEQINASNKNRKWHLPIVSEILEDIGEVEISASEIRKRVKVIEETLASFGVEAKVREINQGPAVTQFGIEPGYTNRKDSRGNPQKVRVSKIVNLSNDLALALAAAPIRIEAPIPGRPYVGIEVPNMSKATVSLRSALDSPVFRNKTGALKVPLGRNVAGKPVVVDLAAMPHMLIAGATGSGKSVCINATVASLLTDHTPETLRFLMIDPKMVELVNYNGIPHLLAPVVTDLERVVGVLNWATREMERRYKTLAKIGVRNITSFNEKAHLHGEDTLPYIVIIVDELADLMMVAPDEVERSIARIAQMARAVGMHLILATQRPSVDVVTGLIKANFPARVAFAVSSQIDSRVILDSPGADRLLGKGDMLYMAPDSAKLRRLQGVFVSDDELNRLIKFWGGGVDRVRPSIGTVEAPGPLEQKALWDEFAPKPKANSDDALLEKAIEVVKKHQRASISLLQRRLRIGYARAARLIDQLEEQGIIGKDQNGGKGRAVLVENTPPENHEESSDDAS